MASLLSVASAGLGTHGLAFGRASGLLVALGLLVLGLGCVERSGIAVCQAGRNLTVKAASVGEMRFGPEDRWSAPTVWYVSTATAEIGIGDGVGFRRLLIFRRSEGHEVQA